MEINNIQSMDANQVYQSQTMVSLPPNMPNGPITIPAGETVELYAGITITNDLDKDLSVTLGFDLQGGFYVRTEPFYRKTKVRTYTNYSMSQIIGERFCIMPLQLYLQPGETYTLDNGAKIVNDTDQELRFIYEQTTSGELKIVDLEGHFLANVLAKPKSNLEASKIINWTYIDKPVRQNRLLNQLGQKA